MTVKEKNGQVRAACAALVAAFAFAAGCGGGDATPMSDEQQVRALYQGYAAAVTAGDAEGVCGRMTPALRRRKGLGGTCVAWHRKIYRVAPSPPENVYFTRLKVKGNQAFGLVRGRGAVGGDPYPIRFAKLEGEWKMSGRGTTGGGLPKWQDTSDSSSDEIRSSYAGFVDYLRAASPRAVCDRLTRSFQQRLGGNDCKSRLDEIFADRNFRDSTAKVVELRVSGRRATAIVRARSGGTYPVRFAKEKNRWKVDGGSPLEE